MDEILELLRQNARLSAEDISAMTKKTVDEVKAIIKKLEDDGVILKYAAIVNPEKEKNAKEKVRAETLETASPGTAAPPRGGKKRKKAERRIDFPEKPAMFQLRYDPVSFQRLHDTRKG